MKRMLRHLGCLAEVATVRIESNRTASLILLAVLCSLGAQASESGLSLQASVDINRWIEGLTDRKGAN